jgi:hypothetical protein
MIAFPLSCRPHLLLLSTLCGFVAEPAWAADTSPGVVLVRATSCEAPRDDAALRHALEVELAAMHVETRWEMRDAEAATPRVSLSAECAADTGVLSLRVWSSVPHLVVERSVALRDVPEAARARTLALVISEALGPALADARRAAGSEDEAAEGASSQRTAFPAATTAVSSLDGPLFTRADPYYPADLFNETDPYGARRALRLAAAAQARLAAHDSAMLLAFEVSASGPLAGAVDWGIEVSRASAMAWKTDRTFDVNWWNASIGTDIVSARTVSLAFGPRLSLGHLTVEDSDVFSTRSERTLVTQFGGRAKIDAPLSRRSSVQMMVAADRTLGVLALTHYTGLDREVRGWLLSWGMGLAVEL